ncbi:MAG: hypothetical protein AB1638_01560, partial [Nitrospirota bacterium]
RIYSEGGKMRIKSLFIICHLLFVILFLCGCGGGGPGEPGSQGTEDTGVMLDASITPTYLGQNTASVDVFQQVCDAGPPPKYEDFTDHQATLTIVARLLNPDTTFQPGNLYIEKYTVDFHRSSESLSIGAPPIESDIRFQTIPIAPPTGTNTNTVTATVVLVDLKRKLQYLNDVESGQFSSGPAFLNNYTATYTFEGKNEFGTRFVVKAQKDFQIGSFDYCD